jgi:hypothetical protein
MTPGGALAMESGSRVVLDACCLINLYATGRCPEILANLPYTFTAARAGLEEANYLVRELEDGTYERLEIDWNPLIQGKLVAVLELETEAEQKLFVDLSVRLDDGEAATLALAIQRGYAVATDEKKAVKLLKNEFPTCTVTSTLSLLKDWEGAAGSSPAEVTQALRRIRDLAHYEPGPGHDLYDWWNGRI